MSWAAYGPFLALAVVLILIPGPAFAVVTRNALAGGRRRGSWSATGIASANAVQGVATAAGLGAVIVRLQPLFQALRWAGIAYLLYLGAQALRSGVRGHYPPLGTGERPGRAAALHGWRQGFLTNITNPKALLFYLAVLPQFLSPHAGIPVLLAFALSHAVLSLGYWLLVAATLHRARRLLARRRVRRAVDGATAVALLGFSVRLAAEHG